MNTDNGSNESGVDPSSGQFVDPLFAIFIAAAVTETIIPWTNGAWVCVHFFDICVVMVGFVNLLLSWFGYHKSVFKKPIKGSIRFIVTVILLPLYMLTIILYKNGFLSVMIIYAAIFFLWSLWEYLRNFEYGNNFSFLKIVFRGYNILIYSTLIALIVVAKLPEEYATEWYVKGADSIALFLLSFSILWLRVSKSAGKEGTPAFKIKSEILNLLFGDREDKHTKSN